MTAKGKSVYRPRTPEQKARRNQLLRQQRREATGGHRKHYTDAESVLIGVWSGDDVPTEEQAVRLHRTRNAIKQARQRWQLEPPASKYHPSGKHSTILEEDD